MLRKLYRNLRTEKQGTLDANGRVAVTIQVPYGPSWDLNQIGVKVAVTGDVIPSAATYVGLDESGVFVSSTIVGSNDTDSDPRTLLHPGDSLTCVWTGGTPGDIATLTVTYSEVA